ncbi:MAG: DUF5320 domain-containing protein [Deltaproteobacteria bacterium]|nr:DUF5320 domain-containing protein [Deltaproteobacteria bacterium]MBW2170385.1 DUF5320 domain-containing protein [Deltaproteobacteria bacterium]MBW2259784.1 DUF5320 domain-containing protein [Deltaproteobacteria bacterium]
MPGFDRTGPLAEGPRTGRGLGRCGKANETPVPDNFPGRRVRSGDGPAGGQCRGLRAGRGRSGRRGRGRS